MGYMLPTEHKQAKLSPSSAKASLVLVLTLNRLFLSSRCSHSRERVGWGGVVVKPRSSHESCRLWALLKAAPANKNPNNGKYREVKRHQLQHISFLGQKSIYAEAETIFWWKTCLRVSTDYIIPVYLGSPPILSFQCGLREIPPRSRCRCIICIY